jgi:hypothetical protein
MDESPAMKAIENEDEAGRQWAHGIAKEWVADLNDSRQDLYASDDGKPVEPEATVQSGREPSNRTS